RATNSAAFMSLGSRPPPRSRWLEKRSSALAALLLLAAIALAYGGTLAAPFVYDDVLAIPQNESIRQLWPLTDVLWPQVEGGLTISGRPVLNLSLALNYAISGTRVWSYHVFNILVHAGASCLLFGLVRRTLATWSGWLPRVAGMNQSPANAGENRTLLT